MMYMYLYSLAFMDHPCTLGAAVCHQAPPCPLYTQPRARLVWARRTNGLKIVSTWAGFEPTIYTAWKSSALTTRPPSPHCLTCVASFLMLLQYHNGLHRNFVKSMHTSSWNVFNKFKITVVYRTVASNGTCDSVRRVIAYLGFGFQVGHLFILIFFYCFWLQPARLDASRNEIR